MTMRKILFLILEHIYLGRLRFIYFFFLPHQRQLFHSKFCYGQNRTQSQEFTVD